MKEMGMVLGLLVVVCLAACGASEDVSATDVVKKKITEQRQSSAKTEVFSYEIDISMKYLEARGFLGNDLIAPEETGETYTSKQLKWFANALPNAHMLVWLRENGFGLVAGPPCGRALYKEHLNTFVITKQPQLVLVVPTKQCGLIISISYMSCLLAAHSEKSDVYKVTQGSIPKSALLCRDYPL